MFCLVVRNKSHFLLFIEIERELCYTESEVNTMFQSFSADVINSLSPLELEVLRYISTHKNEIAGM